MEREKENINDLVVYQQRNPDRSFAVTEALTYVPGMSIDIASNPRKLYSVLR